ncbi:MULTISPECIES: lytic transglycosylase domain-containing protein [Rhodobacterales]|uniref:lytic transglycosylase domain-containing protein n=1 Tax=Rhodobacterales TaxID=204455 RepID=UPI00237FD3E1|nr:lytic transglycosylase domain-containing protein [Phaeobacter gallaeciensis]MDE4139535.1 lytic transglycosylase domain-containing protein [Phaeobacter gallaeciensis]MDE4147407.1 lytic transglycosylase domain-containing protein [Phaeobacter gallaeciensis]MDE4151626.1 lytic transglycosylase domain-containing protein [Phaeobacter gallaeciensis]MDE4227590.1 lytic transglycosylase domain-containing protein [Phaeobacter gallaeciensis]MDE4256090.1 lytic transglycosylase domain-containing protein [
MHRRHVFSLLALPLLAAGCGSAPQAVSRNEPPLFPNETPDLRRKINYWSDHYEVPRSLVHRLAVRESTHRPTAVNRPYYGLLQILPATARSMGFKGKPQDLLDPDTNLEFSVKYLRGAWLLADGSEDTAVKHYSRGYYYEAKRRGMLKETGLRT